ncbi:MAG: ATP-dependent RecD-like DNA helicase [Victivallales bacterium]|nr:ATP-dependent RecD-like DNA helicase [Victivallales bacterium]
MSVYEENEQEELDFPSVVTENAPAYAATTSTIRGEVKRIVYASEDGGYTVIRLTDTQNREQTLVGNLANVLEGQEIEASGRWELHPTHGRQFHVEHFQALLPSSPDGIRKYLASGILPGIGETYANRIVDHFGADTLHILDTASERLKEVPGIGRRRITDIRAAWQKSTAERGSRIFLQGLGISPAFCTRIMNKWGNGAAAEIVRRNPYQLAADIDGIGFTTADTIAKRLNIQDDHPQRLCAGVVYAMDELSAQGHTCCPREILAARAAKLLNVPLDNAQSGIQAAIQEGRLIAEKMEDDGETLEMLSPRRLRQAERGLAHSLRVLLNTQKPPLAVPMQKLGSGYQRLNAGQRQAVDFVFQYTLTIVTGGPGVGKTTVVNQIAAAAQILRLKVNLAAPTGRAAKRLSEATGREAETIHRLLKWDVQTGGFIHNQDNPLSCDLLVVDEASMLDTQLADSLFKAVAPGTRVVLVGDCDQLPSVGPGAVLNDLIASRCFPVTFLTEVYRQKEGSRIITNAHAVNQGRMPDVCQPPPGTLADFYWIEQSDPAKVAELIVRLVTERIPHAYGLNPITDVQVLAPMRKGECGMEALNASLKNALNPEEAQKPSFSLGSRSFRVGDKVMQTRNNYDKGVFNGETGLVTSIDNDMHLFQVTFDIGTVEYRQSDADQLVLAYAVTVHKSQGSEYPAVVMPLHTQHYVMLQKNLLYTGMTRARKLLILVGTRRALSIAVNNATPAQRRTLLLHYLKETQ